MRLAARARARAPLLRGLRAGFERPEPPAASVALARAFSSSSGPNDGEKRANDGEKRPNEPNDGEKRALGAPGRPVGPFGWLEDVRATFARARERRSVFRAYESRGVFQRSASRVHRLSSWLLFFQLNRPSETQIDAEEFLEGARVAMEATMRAMYSREFAEFVDQTPKASWAEAAERQPVAWQLRETLESVSFDAFAEFLRFSRAAGIRSELQELEIHSAHVVGVSFRRIPSRPTTNSSGAVVVRVPMDEHLAIQVEFDVTEHFDMAMPDFIGGLETKVEGKEVVVRHNKAVWQFASKVTTPDDIDWVIEPLDLATV